MFVLLPSLRIFSALRPVLACTDVLPVRDLQTFAASIDPAKPVIDNVLVARTGNNDSKEYWLARATTKPRRSTPLDDEDIPPNTLVVEVCLCVHAYVCL